jgi:hypothetical protein
MNGNMAQIFYDCVVRREMNGNMAQIFYLAFFSRAARKRKTHAFQSDSGSRFFDIPRATVEPAAGC